jgi:hypothetical protein
VTDIDDGWFEKEGYRNEYKEGHMAQSDTGIFPTFGVMSHIVTRDIVHICFWFWHMSCA